MSRRIVWAGVATAVTAIAAIATIAARAGLRPNAGSGARIAGYRPDLARGEAVHAGACAACHGSNLEGEANWRSPGPDGRLPAPPHDASGHTWHHPDRVLLDIAMRGTAAVVGGGHASNMPGCGGVWSEDELRDVPDVTSLNGSGHNGRNGSAPSRRK